MVDMEKRKATNKKLWTVLGILFLMIGCLCNLEEKPQVEQTDLKIVEKTLYDKSVIYTISE